MAHQDQGRCGAEGTGADELYQALRWTTAKANWAPIQLRKDCTWTPWWLVFTALLWALSDQKTLGDRFQDARKITGRLRPGQDEPAASYQAFTKLLCRWTGPLLAVLRRAFQARMRQSLKRVWRVGQFVVLACDGSRIGLPRTRGNEARYSSRSKLSRAARKLRSRRRRQRRSRLQARQRQANVPTMWLTTLWHVGSGLPWDWRLGPADSSERGHLLEMLAAAPAGALITADAGFVGYDLWQAVIGSGRHLLVRVGSNVKLLKKLGYAEERQGLVYLWPDKAARKNQPPLVLRLVVVHDGQRPAYLVTSVLGPKKLSDLQAARVYRRRWGIELFYRHCKQTFEHGKLRSRNPDNALVEMHWTLLGLWALGLHSHHHLLKRGVMPEKVSFARTLHAYRQSMRGYKSAPDPGQGLSDLLNVSVIDSYHRKNKASRDYPQKKQQEPPGPPEIRIATRQQIQKAKELKTIEALGLTA
jgi:IS4 transposase